MGIGIKPLIFADGVFYNLNKKNIIMKTKLMENLRFGLGILGMLLPILLYLVNGSVLLRSISHTYYTHAGIIFIITMVSFGIILMTYTGYAKSAVETVRIFIW